MCAAWCCRHVSGDWLERQSYLRTQTKDQQAILDQLERERTEKANKEVEMTQQDSKVLLTCGSSRFELPVIPLDDYPQLPVLPEVTGTLESC